MGSLALVVAALYGAALRLPYVADDWEFLLNARRPAWRVITGAFNPFRRVLYRPAADLYFLALGRASGFGAVAAYACSLALAAVGAIGVFRVARRLTGDLALGWAAALTYAAAATVQLEPLSWASGFQDLGASALAWSAFAIFLDGRARRSAALFAAALLCKESVIVLPLLLGLAAPAQVRRLWPHALAAAAFAAVKLAGKSPFAPGPYQVSLLGKHLSINLGLYSRWAAEALVPYSAWPGIALTAVAAAGFARARSWRRPFALLAWAVIGLLPVLFLIDHSYRYFLLTSLPAIALFWWSGLAALTGPRAAALIAGACALTAAPYLWSGREPPDGVNGLRSAAAEVRAVRAALERDPPPRGVVLVFDGPAFATGFAAGPRLWLDDPTVSVAASGEPLPPDRPVRRWRGDRFEP